MLAAACVLLTACSWGAIQITKRRPKICYVVLKADRFLHRPWTGKEFYWGLRALAGLGLETPGFPASLKFSVILWLLKSGYHFFLCFATIFYSGPLPPLFHYEYKIIGAILKVGCWHSRHFCNREGLELLLKLSWVSYSSAGKVSPLVMVYRLN